MCGQNRPPGEWDATAYHRLSQPQVEWGERVLRRLALRGDETVMDAGCGTGRLTARLLERLREAGFVDIETSLEPAPAVLGSTEEYREFLSTVIFGVHLERMPNNELRAKFLDTLTEQASRDTPPFSLDYWRLNLEGKRPRSGG